MRLTIAFYYYYYRRSAYEISENNKHDFNNNYNSDIKMQKIIKSWIASKALLKSPKKQKKNTKRRHTEIWKYENEEENE